MRHSKRVSRWTALSAFLILVAGAGGCASGQALRAGGIPPVGIASYYGKEHAGLRTASGERYDLQGMTAAHPTLPFGTRVRVTNLDNGRKAVVRINDRGPFRRGRIIDVSYAAARELGLIGPGLARVRLDVL
jgi:rare lipoprotein A